MSVLKIVTNVAADNTADAAAFYKDFLGLEAIMNLGWIVTYASGSDAATQISIASEGGSGTPVPDISMEVDNLDELYAKAKSFKFNIVYDITEEPWGVRRFYVEDPMGKIINLLEHSSM